MHPLVTYIVAALNAEATLAEALDSLIGQTLPDWLAIVVDDGSTDRTLSVAEDFVRRDRRIRVISQANAGPARARNRAAREAGTEFIAALDSDDMLVPEHLARMLALQARFPECDVLSSDGYFVDPDGSMRPVFGYDSVRSVTLEQLMLESLILGGGTLVRRQAFLDLGGYRPDIYCEDYDLWLRVLAAGSCHVATGERLYLYRVGGPTQKSADKVASVDSAISALEGLAASGSLSEAQESIARSGIAHYRAALALESQAVSLRRAVEQLFGPRMAPTILSAVHSVSWATRPIRRLFARHVTSGRSGVS